jgi:preprotein translocase subunit YajC
MNASTTPTTPTSPGNTPAWLTLAQEGVKPSAGNSGAATPTPGTTSAADPSKPATGARPGPAPQGPDQYFFLFMILMLVVFWFVAMGGQRREKKKKQEMLSSLKKGDKVQTIGGIIGSVVEVRDHYVVLKVDESNNTRLKLTRNAIHGVMADDEKPQE